MATTVEPIGSPHVARTTSGGAGGYGGNTNERFVDKVVAMQWINKGFIFSILGGLQIAVVVLGLLTVSLLGAAMSHALTNTYAYFMVSGYSFFAFLFIVSFWCFMTSVILVITCATSVNTATSLIRTTFYLGYHGTSAAFYLFGSLALLIEGAKFEQIWIHVDYKKSENLKELVYTGGCIGMIEFILYLIITIFAVRKFRQPAN